MLGAYGRDELNNNVKRLLIFAKENKLAVTSTCFSSRKGGVSHTFNGISSRNDQQLSDYIVTRQAHRSRVYDVKGVDSSLARMVFLWQLQPFPFLSDLLASHSSEHLSFVLYCFVLFSFFFSLLFFPHFLWSGLFCCVLVPGTLRSTSLALL